MLGFKFSSDVLFLSLVTPLVFWFFPHSFDLCTPSHPFVFSQFINNEWLQVLHGYWIVLVGFVLCFAPSLCHPAHNGEEEGYGKAEASGSCDSLCDFVFSPLLLHCWPHFFLFFLSLSFCQAASIGLHCIVSSFAWLTFLLHFFLIFLSKRIWMMVVAQSSLHLVPFISIMFFIGMASLGISAFISISHLRFCISISRNEIGYPSRSNSNKQLLLSQVHQREQMKSQEEQKPQKHNSNNHKLFLSRSRCVVLLAFCTL